MIDRKIIFLGGVHGVGKTEFCSKIIKTIQIEHISAGGIIKKYLGKSKEHTDKQVDNVQGNQNVLLQALDRYHSKSHYILLDGHFCLLGKEDLIQEIPADTFIQINPITVIVLRDHPEIIASRLNSRDQKNYPIETILSLQECEISVAQSIATLLNVDCNIYDPTSDLNKAIEYIKNIQS